ncbi:2-pyrone-4,6-dicarboxylate hydrolase [Limnohabitans sp. JirII-29]|uniref:amidohydrolase family protein n=1 Tax=Limnohabitans sp. JirII-29 TaxID=1835756 RepID=UPI000D37BD36|nr:amidohydrolase family protein [Limnohabitans sp. JirII-29]PUE26190.1 2-pyrone-4,6-dicarboxylate hydrolase [Limnohabitans sp. JirII-29]
MSIFDLPKIDSHCHVLDPQRFAYASDVAYHPQGQEIGTADYFAHVMDAYGVQHALLVGPNSGYGFDNRCLLDAIAQGAGRFKGIAVLADDTSSERLQELQAQGIVGVAFNVSLHGLAYYQAIEPLLQRMAALGLWAQFQVEADQLVELMPMIARTQVPVLIDHCGRPRLSDGLQAPGVQALLALGRSGQAVVKISGYAKFSQQLFPFDDVDAHVAQLVQAFGMSRCIWASDWPYLKAPYRLDYGTLLKLVERKFSPEDLQQVMWDNPKRLFGF